MTRERVSGATFDEVVDIARQIEMVRSQERVEMEANRPRGSGDFSGVPAGAHRGASASHGSYSAHSGQSSFSALPAQSSHHASSTQPSTDTSSAYQEQQFRQRRGCFECGELGHFKRDCPRLLSEAPQHSSRPMTPAPIVTPPTLPARGGGQASRCRPRGGGRSCGGQARFNAFPARPDIIASDAVITGKVRTSETGRIDTETRNSEVEVGAYYHGLRSWTPMDFEKV
ncbi:uncharacterized protein [Nicotiana tomentosiformis]|uniref:uncharacterized protein n=1 Tax=Nicotiana tomentosiformis TaxID=4098 RepID=UPI00388C3DC4